MGAVVGLTTDGVVREGVEMVVELGIEAVVEPKPEWLDGVELVDGGAAVGLAEGLTVVLALSDEGRRGDDDRD